VEQGIADLVTLRLNGRPIATQAGFQIGGTYSGQLHVHSDAQTGEE
jgi:hypothetical protein